MRWRDIRAHTDYKWIQSTANADVAAFARSPASGLLAGGITERHPEFMALSAWCRNKTDANAVQAGNSLVEADTTVEIQTRCGMKRTRFGGSPVTLITEQGSAKEFSLDWMLEAFTELRDAADCFHEAATNKTWVCSAVHGLAGSRCKAVRETRPGLVRLG